MPTADGVALSRVAASSPAAALGLKSGDLIAAVNGLSLSSPDRVLDAYSKLRQASQLSLEVVRDGRRVTMDYALR
jgi:S1-C subfamily serine protease